MAVITINAKNFIAGESTTEWIADRGFSPDSSSVNLTKQRGLLYFSPDPTDRAGATLTGEIIAACPDPAGGASQSYMVDDEGAMYTLDGTTLTKRQTSAHTYTGGKTDIIVFNDLIYATHERGVVEMTATMGGISDEWWSGLGNLSNHPLEVVEGEMFIADRNIIYYWNGTSSGTAFTVPTSQVVTTLRRHPNGVDLIAFTGNAFDRFHIRHAGGKAYICDPQIRDWKREIDLGVQIDGSQSVGGIVYVSYGKNIGYFNGDQIVFLKKVSNTLDPTTNLPIYSHKMRAAEDELLVCDGRSILSFGDVGGGNIWRNIWRNAGSAQPLSMVLYKGNGVVLGSLDNGSGGGFLWEIDQTNTGTGGVFYTNRIDFGGEVIINRIDIIHEKSTIENTKFLVYSVDQDDTENDLKNNTSINTVPINSFRSRIQCNVRTDIFQLRISPINEALGIKSIRIYYDQIK